MFTPDQIEKRVAAAKDLGATEVHIVGGFHPDLQLDYDATFDLREQEAP